MFASGTARRSVGRAGEGREKEEEERMENMIEQYIVRGAANIGTLAGRPVGHFRPVRPSVPIRSNAFFLFPCCELSSPVSL